MFRKWLSGFINKNREKIETILKVCLIGAVIIFIIYLSTFNKRSINNNVNKDQTIYKPEETIISGKNINQEQYQKDSNIIKTFIECCNEGKIDEAYNLLTDECKENLYNTVEDFKEQYCERYFNTKKEFNLQSWIKNGNTTTYQVRILNDIIALGKYNSNDTYQDYITLINNEKININGYIGKKSINKTTQTNEINVKVIESNIYMDYVEYTLEVTNKTDNVMILDSMENLTDTVKLIASENDTYPPKINSIRYIELIINPEESRKIKMQFNKKYTSETNVNSILFSKVVKNYNEFIQNKTEYNDFIEIKVEL